MVSSQARCGEKVKKYEDFLIVCYAKLMGDDFAPFWRYGYEIYLLRQEKRRSISPKLDDCESSIIHKSFGFISDKLAIHAAQNYIANKSNSEFREQKSELSSEF
jgi:hypothetical protein